MKERVVIAGVGMVPFTTAGSTAGGIAEYAIRAALADAGLDAELVDQAVAGHVYGDSRSGESALARAGLTGIAISNVSNGAVAGSAALFHARQALRSGEAECALAVGFEEVADAAEPLPGLFRRCGAQLEWIADRIGVRDATFARIVVKSRAHAARNPYALHREPLAIEQALSAPLLGARLRRSYVSEASCGAAAVVLCTPRFAAHHTLRDDVYIAAQALEGEDPADAESADVLDALGRSTTRRVAEKAYEFAGVDPADINVAEVHDCCVSNELVAYAALGFCAEDEVERFVESGANTFGGAVVVSPSGGLLARGHALGATGLAQICELTWQLRGDAGARQVPGARAALQHNGGLGGPVSVAILRRSY